MNQLIKFIHHLPRPILTLLLIFAASLIAIFPTHATSHYPSPADLTTAKYNVQSVGAYAKYAALASAVTGIEANNATVDSLIAAIADIDSTFHFVNQTPSKLVSLARNLPFYKEYAYLRTLVNEINYLYNNYDHVSTSEEAWKIPYIIDRAENAIEGCNLIFGTNRQNTTANQPANRSANQDVDLVSATPYSAASATVIAEYAAKTDVLRSADSSQLPRRHQSNSNVNNTQNASTSSTSTSNDSTQPTSANPDSDATAATNPSKTDSPTTDSDSDDSPTQNINNNSQATLVAVAAHTSTAITTAGTLFIINRRLRKNH